MLQYSFYPYNNMYIKIGSKDHKLHYVQFTNTIDTTNEQNAFNQAVKHQLMQYFKGKQKEFSIQLHIQGTPFQQAVYKELLKIPYGKTISYKDLAMKINKPTAYRAVGNANNKNPIAIIIPCHRVIKNNGDQGGYASGTSMKEKLLTLEQIKNEP